MSEIKIFPIHDPAFRVESVDNYQTLIGWMFNFIVQMQEEYPEDRIWPVYLLRQEDIDNL